MLRAVARRQRRRRGPHTQEHLPLGSGGVGQAAFQARVLGCLLGGLVPQWGAGAALKDVSLRMSDTQRGRVRGLGRKLGRGGCFWGLPPAVFSLAPRTLGARVRPGW